MNRRATLKGLGLFALTAVSAPSGLIAQPAAKTFKMGLLATTRPTGQPPAGPGSGESVVVALSALGYVEGRNIVIERRYSEGVLERLPGFAAELVGFQPDVVFALGAAQAQAVQRATATIPIVAVGGDLVALGLVASLARPGGNVTGLQFMQFETAGKRLALLKEAIPGISRVGLLFATDVAAFQRFYDITSSDTQRAALTLGLTLQIAQANDPIGLDTAFATLARERAQAVLIPSTQLAAAQRRQLADLARKHRMASVGDERIYAEAGFFMSYGPNTPEFIPHAATFIDKILRGAKPADLPVEQPTKFELVINLRTAKALALTIPQSLLQRADEAMR